MDPKDRQAVERAADLLDLRQDHEASGGLPDEAAAEDAAEDRADDRRKGE